MFRKIVSFFRNVHFQSFFSIGSMALLGILTSAVIFRALSLSDVGYYFYFMTFIGFVDTIKLGFLTNALVKFYSGTSFKRGREVTGSIWTMAIILSGLIVLINLFTIFLNPYIKNYALRIFNTYFAINTLITLPIAMAVLMMQAERRFDRLFWTKVINQVLFLGSVLLYIILRKIDFLMVIYLMLITNSITSIIVLALKWTKIRTILYTTYKSLLEIFHFGKYSVGATLSSTLFKVTDTFIIDYFLGPSALALYNIGGRLVQIVEVPILSFVGSVGPALSAFYNKNMIPEMIGLMKKTIGMLTLTLLVAVLVADIFAVPLISLLGGGKYTHSEAPNLFRIFVTIAVFYPTDRFFALTLDVIHMPKVNFLKVLAMLFVNFLGDYVGVAIFHSVFAIVVTNIFPVLTGIIISYFFLKRNLKFEFWSIYKTGYQEILIIIGKLFKGMPFTKIVKVDSN